MTKSQPVIDITTTDNLYQENPPHGDPRDDSWKTWLGYARMAKRLSIQILKNGQDYRWLVNINIDGQLTQITHSKIWKAISRNLRKKGIVCLWIREVSKSNRIHYHIIVPEQEKLKTIDEVRDTFRQSLPRDYKDICRVHPEGIYNVYNTAFYITKATNKHKHKRLLFSKSCSLDKYGSIGDFWLVHKDDAIWQNVISYAREKSAEDMALEEFVTPELRAEAIRYHELIDGHRVYDLDYIVKCLARHAAQQQRP